MNSAQSEASSWRSRVARLGLIGKGLLYTSLGLLAIDVALSGGGSASQQGAIEQVARAPFGRFLLIVLTVALIALVVWKALQAAAGDPVEGSDASDRAFNGIKAVAYSGAAITSATILAANWGESLPGSGGSGGSGESSEEQAAAVVMDWPAGRWLVALIGLIAIGYGIYQFVTEVAQSDFMSRLSVPNTETRSAIEAAGRVGYAAKAGVVIGIGVFFVIAGIQHDDDEARGLSGLLQSLAGDPWGQVALWVIAVGLFAFGLFTLAEAKYRRAT